MLYITGSNFNNLVIMYGKCYGFTGFIKNEDITDNIEIVQLHGQTNNNNKSLLSNMASFFHTVKVKASCTIHLKDKRTIDVITDQRDLIEFLIPHMHVKKKRGG